MLLKLGGKLVAGRESVADHDHRTDDRTALVVGRGDNGRFGDRGVRHERRLNFERADPVPGRDDHVVGAPFEVQEAVLVLRDAVARVPRAVSRRVAAAEVADEERRVGVRVGQHQLAVDHLQVDAGKRAPHRPRPDRARRSASR